MDSTTTRLSDLDINEMIEDELRNGGQADFVQNPGRYPLDWTEYEPTARWLLATAPISVRMGVK